MEFFDPDKTTYIQPEVSYYQAAQPLPSRLIFSPIILSKFPNTSRKLKVKELPRIFQGTRLYRIGDNIVYFQGTMGAPATVMFLETLIALGIREVIFLGFAGSIQQISIGDRLLITEAIRLEGTSYHYLPSTSKCRPAKSLTEALSSFLSKKEFQVYQGKICSTDAPFRETYTLIETLRKKNVLAIDMEVAAAFAVANFRRISLTSLVIISDELRDNQWLHVNSDSYTRSYINSFSQILDFYSDRI
ncbi:MAG: hypothetical protein ACFFFG_18260 [Candidatus Thorarchaeota archaeon]